MSTPPQIALDPMRRGDTYTFEATVTDEGTAVDLTGWSIRSTGKRLLTDTDADALYTVTKAGGGITVTGASNNVARVVIPASATLALTAPITMFWDVQITNGSANHTVALGTLAVFLDVSQTTP